MIEFRWIRPSGTTTADDVLQWRVSVALDASGALCPGATGQWWTVPLVVLPTREFRDQSIIKPPTTQQAGQGGEG